MKYPKCNKFNFFKGKYSELKKRLLYKYMDINELNIDDCNLDNIVENVSQSKIDPIKNTSLIKNDVNFNYPPYIMLTETIKPSIILDLNGILIYSSHLIDIKDLSKYSQMKNFLLVYKDFDNNMFIIYYRSYIKEFLLELNNYFDIYVYSSLNKMQTDIFISTINHLIGVNVFKGIYIKINPLKNKSLEDLNLNNKYTIILDYNDKQWSNNLENLIVVSTFKGPYDVSYDKNIDLLVLKKCLLRIYKLFVDNNCNDIRNYIHSSIISS